MYLYLVCGHNWISLLDIEIFITISTKNYLLTLTSGIHDFVPVRRCEAIG